MYSIHRSEYELKSKQRTKQKNKTEIELFQTHLQTENWITTTSMTSWIFSCFVLMVNILSKTSYHFFHLFFFRNKQSNSDINGSSISESVLPSSWYKNWFKKKFFDGQKSNRLEELLNFHHDDLHQDDIFDWS